VSSFPITDAISFNSEANFLYRTLLKAEVEEGRYDIEYSISELVLSFPLMFHIAPASMPVYLAGGLQIDLPFSTEEEVKVTYDGESESESEDFEDRATVDFGIAFGAGYRISSHLEIDLRIVIGMTHLTTNNDDKSSLKTFGLGVTCFF